jgi:hypothetical protein
MRSSQALAQSVFGARAALGRLDVLPGIEAEDGYPALLGAADGFAVAFRAAVGHGGRIA